MANKKDENNWLILIAVIIIIVIVIALSSPNNFNTKEQEEEVKKRNIEEAKLESELNELEKKMEIYIKHESINKFTEDYMNELCEKRFKQLIQALIVLLILANLLIYFTVPKIDIVTQFTWNGMALAVLNIAAIFFFMSVKKGKEYLKGIAMNYIEFRVYENRDKTYFTKKVEFYRNEIERLKQEFDNKANELNLLKNKSNNNLRSAENE